MAPQLTPVVTGLTGGLGRGARLEARAHELWTEQQTQQSICQHSALPRMPCPACVLDGALYYKTGDSKDVRPQSLIR